ncbi:phage tail protein [Bacillus velezensis]|uniref:phage tail protein n=1 Tax=Bacillus velezensis TaxID=492670 RepID=UPI002FFE3564
MIERLTAIVEAQTRKFNRSMDRVNDIMRRMADHHTVEIDAEIASFQARVRQASQQIDNFVHRHERTRVDLDADSDPLTRAINWAKQRLRQIPQTVTTQLMGNVRPLSSALARAKAGLSAVANRITTTIDGNPTPLGRAVAVARSAIASISHNVTTTFNAATSPIMRGVSAVRSALASLPNRITTVINGNTAALMRSVATARAALASLPRRVWISIEARIDRFETSMNRLAKITNSVSTVIGHSIAGALTSLLPAISPALASIVGVIGSLGPMLGVAAGGVMGLTSAFATAGTGAAAFGALAITSISGVFKASEDLAKLQEKLDNATSAKERAKIMKQINNLQKSLGKEEREALKNLEDFKDNWRDIGTMVQKPILKTFGMSLNTFKLALNSLIPMFDGLAKEGVGLAKSMDKAFKAPDMQRFISYLNKEAPGAFASFGRSAGNVLRTVFNLIVAFGPAGKSMTKSIEGITQSWVKWSANLGSSKKFQAFVEYTKTNGPKLLQIIRNFSGGLTKLFTGFAPMSQDMMTSLVDLTKRFNEWAGSVTKTKEFQSFIDYIKTNGPTVWSTLGQIAKTIINLLVGMAPLGKTILENVNGFLKFTNAAMEANPAIGKFIAVGISLLGALRAIVPAIVAVSAVTNGLKDFKDAADYLRTFKTTAAGIKLAGLIGQLKSAIATMGQFIAKYTAMAASATANAVKMAASWTAMKISALISALKRGIVQMGLWIKNMTVMAAQSIASAARTATAWTAMKITSFITMLTNGIKQMGLFIAKMTVLAAQSIAQATRMAAAWTAAQISNFISLLVAGGKQMVLFGRQLVVLAAQAAAQAARMAASWVIAMGPIGWITAAVVGLVALIIANWDTVKSATIAAWGAISSWLSTVWTGIKTIATSTWNGIKSFFSTVWNGIVSAAKSIWNGLKTFFSSVWNGVKTAFTTVWNGIKSFATSTWKGIVSVGKSVWNGLKTFFSSVWNGMKTAFTSIWNGIKTIATSIWKGVVSVGKSIWNGLKTFFTSWLNTQKKIFSTVWNAIKTVVTTVWKVVSSTAKSIWNGLKSFFSSMLNGTKSVFTSVWNAVKGFVTGLWKGLVSTAKSLFNSMKNAISGIMKSAKSTITSIWNGVMKFFRGINLWQIGKNIIQGLINGISGMAGALASKVKSMANAIPNGMKKLLGIHSPSRVMRDKVGYHVGTGMAAGIDKSQGKVKAAAAKAAKSAQKAAEVKVSNKIKNAEVKYDTKKMGADTYIKTLQKIQKQNKLTSEQNRKIQREIYQASKSASDKQKKLLKEQQRKEAKAKLAYTKKVSDQIKKAEAKYDTGKISGNTYIKTLEKIKKKNKLNSDQQIKVQREIYQTQKAMADKARKQKEAEKKAADKLNKGILSANNTYLSKFKSVNDKLTADIKAANDAYKKELQDRTDAIYNAIGLFDDVSSEKVNGSKLTANLKKQLDKIKTFNNDISKIASRAPKAFTDELKEMGIGSADQINAISRMTDSELNEYVKLWQEKHKLASTQAEQELTGLKNETTKKIVELRSAANKELALLKNDYLRKIGELTVDVKQLGSLKKSGKAIGSNTMAGIISGMKNMQGELAKEANSIASTIEKTIKKKLKIHSPSRLMRDQVGIMVPAGIAVGIQNGIGTVQKAMGAVSDAMTIQQEDLNFAYDTSISSSELGTVRKELSADIRNLELPDRMIVVEMDSKKVGQGVEKPVTDAQKRSNARRERFN